MPLSGLAISPPFCGDYIRLPETAPQAPALEKSSTESRYATTDSHCMPLHIASVNVKSLYAGTTSEQDRTFIPAKAHFLAQQLDWYGYDIVGLQETCTKQVGMGQIGEYIRLMGGCHESGQLGCELWVNRKRIRASIHDFCVLAHDDRRICVRIQAPSIDMIVCVLHSPHSGTESTTRVEWWSQTKKICQRYAAIAPLVMCIDANAQITLPIDGITGTLTDGADNPNESLLVDICRSCNLFIPCTYDDLQANDRGTWHHPSGKWLRIDYVIVPDCWRNQVASTWTDDRIEMSALHEDHRPTGCQVVLSIGPTRKRCTFGQYDWSRINDVATRNELEHAIQNIPKISWDVNVHDHAILIREALHTAMETTLGPAKPTRKASYISDATWATRSGKRKLKQQLERRELSLNHLWLRWGWQAWLSDSGILQQVRPYLQWLLRCERHTAHLRRTLVDTAKELRRNLSQDRSTFATECALRCQDQPIHKVFAELRCLRVGGVFRKRARAPLPYLQHTDGTTAETSSEVAEIWRQHCSLLEAGQEVTTTELYNFVHVTEQHRHIDLIDPSELPTLSCLEKHTRKVRPGKAPGCDLIPSNLLHHLPAPISRLLYPLLLKQAVTLEESVEYKGGLLVSAYKGRGKTTDVRSYRGLMLTSVAGKAIRAAYREGLLRHYYTYTSEGHYSARPCGNVGQAALTLRLFLRLAKSRKMNCGIIFLDIQHAYYSVVRELASGFTGTDEQLCQLFKFFDLPTEVVADLWSLLREGSALEIAGCSRYQQSLLHELGRGTWFKVRNSDKLTQTRGGSRPGDGLADLIFGYIFARLLSALRTDMSAAGLWEDDHWQLQVPRHEILCRGYIPEHVPSNLEICWADDLALAMSSTTAVDIVNRVQAVGGFLLRWIRRYGMKPNLQRGKSETLLHLRGPGSKKLKLELFSPEDPTLDIIIDEESNVQLRITHQYRHLGGQLHYVGSLLQEVKARCGMARAAFTDYRRKVFANKHLSLKHRGQLLHSLILSVLRWNYGAWPAMDKWAFSRYSSTVLNLAKTICYANERCDEVWTRSHDRVLADLSMSSPQEALHVARLGFYTTAYHTAPDCLWILAASERTWINQIDEALQWMWYQLISTTPCTNFPDFIQAWSQQVAGRQRNWRGWIKRAEKHAILQRCNRVRVEHWHADLYERLKMANFGLPPLAVTAEHADSNDLFFCGPCRQIFSKRTAWAVHCFKKHNRQEPLRRFISDGLCRSCGGQYHTTRRLLAHLRYQRWCAVRHVCEHGPLPHVPPGRNAKKEDKDRQLPLPCISGTKPQEPTAEMEYRYRTLTNDDTFTPTLCTFLRQVDDRTDARQEFWALKLRECILSTVAATDDIYNILHYTKQLLTDKQLVLQANTIDYVLQRWTAEWLFDSLDDVVFPNGWADNLSAKNAKATLVQRLQPTDVHGPPDPKLVPRIFFKEILAVHFFSGTRREQDFQSWVNKIETPPGLVLTAVSVDIIFDSRLGDLTNPSTQKRWLSLAYAGIIIAAVLGPPCNTWSVSRWRALLADDGGPRPVRYLDCYFGAASLSLREVLQVALGNALLFFSLDFVFALGITQRVCVLEHPDILDNGIQIPTIWTTGAFAALRKIPGVEILRIHQGVFGAISPKPTRLCITGGLQCDTFFHKFGTFPMPPPLKMQRQGKQFATAPLKEYPAALSAAMAECVSAWLKRELPFFDPGAAQELTLESQELVEPFRVDYSGLHDIRC